MAEKRAGAKKAQSRKRVQEETLHVGDLDQYLFGQGTHYDIYKKLGAHKTKKNGKAGVYFAVWAPNAKGVSLIGDFNGWDETSHPMKRLEPLGIYEVFVPGLEEGALYKYYITTRDGRGLYKADPYANAAELRPGTASKVADITRFRWGDGAWIQARQKQDVNAMPISIYEVHPGSWKKHPLREGDEDGFYNYKELAHALVD